MKNYLKYIGLIILALSAILLTGCAEINIDASISEDNLVTYTYTMYFSELDEENENTHSLETLLLEINSYWKDNNFDSELTSEGDTSTLVCKMEKQCESREEAFQVLYEFMTNEITLFDDVEYSYTKDFYKEDYSIISHIDLSKIIDEDVYNTYPQIVGENIDEIADKVKCTITFSLPSNESTESADITIIETNSDVSLIEPVEINVSGFINNYENIQYENSLIESKNDIIRKIIIFAGSAVLAIIIAIVLLIFKKKFLKQERKSDTPISEDDKN